MGRWPSTPLVARPQVFPSILQRATTMVHSGCHRDTKFAVINRWHFRLRVLYSNVIPEMRAFIRFMNNESDDDDRRPTGMANECVISHLNRNLPRPFRPVSLSHIPNVFCLNGKLVSSSLHLSFYLFIDCNWFLLFILMYKIFGIQMASIFLFIVPITSMPPLLPTSSSSCFNHFSIQSFRVFNLLPNSIQINHFSQLYSFIFATLLFTCFCYFFVAFFYFV